MKKYIKPETEIIDIEGSSLLSDFNYGDKSYDYDTGSPMTKGNDKWTDEEDDLGW